MYVLKGEKALAGVSTWDRGDSSVGNRICRGTKVVLGEGWAWHSIAAEDEVI